LEKGILLALGRVYGNKIISGICLGYIEIIRGTPLLVQLFIIYFGLPQMGISLNPITAASIGLTLNSGAYQAEYLRGSIQSIESGQMIAARTLGMTKIQSIKNIILPQALRISIPAWSNEGKFIAAETFRYLEIFTIIALIYLILTFVLTEIIDKIDNRLSIPGIGVGKNLELRGL